MADKHHTQKQCAESNRSDFRIGRDKVSKGEAEKQSKTSGTQLLVPEQAGEKRENKKDGYLRQKSVQRESSDSREKRCQQRA